MDLEQKSPDTQKPTWTFSKAFWTANGVELLERAAWYGVFVAITLYLSRILGFSDIQAGVVSGVFLAGLYLFPTFAGAYADKIGFRKSLLLAFGLLTIGYGSMWLLPTLFETAGLVSYGREVEFTGLESGPYKWLFVPVMLIVMVGGSFIKSVITGTVARETSEVNRARGFSIFYAVVNIGAFSGKTIVKPLREGMGNEGVLVLLFYKAQKGEGEDRKLEEIMKALVAVCTRWRLVILTLIITGFWMVQGQLYATMPKYVLRMVGEGASPSWYANVNPAVVVLTVGVVTQLLRKRTALFSMTLGMFIMPVSAFAMAAGNMMGDGEIMGFHPVAFMMLVGIGFQGLAESFISPRFLEYFSKQAPKGEEGLYLGFSHLHSFISAIVGFSLSGVLLDRFCPARTQFELGPAGDAAWAAAKVHAHYIWFVFVGIAFAAAVGLIVFGWVTRRMDAEAEA
jgi:dipeptide/tripeptide permease